MTTRPLTAQAIARTAVVVLLLALLWVTVVYAAPPDADWTGSALSVSDCFGIDNQSDFELFPPLADSNPGSCQTYDNYLDTYWDLYETLNYNSEVAYGPAQTADIQTVLIGFDNEWLYLEWDTVKAWNETDADTHNIYAEIDLNDNDEGDYLIGIQLKKEINSATWVDAATNSLLTSEFVGTNTAGATPRQSDYANTHDGYETDNDQKTTADTVYARLRDGNPQLAIKWSYLDQADPPISLCVRQWFAQESTIDKSKLQWHDNNASSDLGSAKYDNVPFTCLDPTAIGLAAPLRAAPVAAPRAILPATGALVVGLGALLLRRRRAA